MKDFGLSRNVPVKPGATALLFVDVQNYSMPGGGEYAHLTPEEIERRYGYFFREMRGRAVPNMRRLQESCREARVEVMYTVIEAIAPVGDEIVIPKTSSSVFISTNIHYVLGNLGVRHLIVAGVLTDQCVDSTVRDACDFGYLVTLVTDACATQSEERHRSSIANNRGYCRQVTTDDMVSELSALRPR